MGRIRHEWTTPKKSRFFGWSMQELKEALIDIWNNEITVEDFNKFIDSMPQRIRKVIARKGAQTPY